MLYYSIMTWITRTMIFFPAIIKLSLMLKKILKGKRAFSVYNYNGGMQTRIFVSLTYGLDANRSYSFSKKNDGDVEVL